MIEVSIWVPVLLVEAWLLSSAVLGFLVWQARRRQRRLHIEVEAFQRGQEGIAKAVPLPDLASVPPADPLVASPDQPDDPTAEAAPSVPALLQINRDLQEELSQLTQQQAVLETTVTELRTANAQLTQELAAKDALLQESHALARTTETPHNEAVEGLQQELQQVKRRLAQRETEFAEMQAQYEDLSSEYQRLFSSLRR